MRSRKIETGYLLRLEFGEELLTTLESFIKKAQIKGGFFTGLGGAQSARLAIYRYDTDNKYHGHDFAGPLEISNLTGNIAWAQDELMLHAHATISGVDFNASAGHVQSMVIAGTCEIMLFEFGRLDRKRDAQTGLKLLDL